MRRVILAAVSTIGGLIMLLSFKTSDVAIQTAPPAAISDGTPAAPTTSIPVPATTGPAAAGSSTPTTPTTATIVPSTQAGTVTVTGSAAATRYGPVEVQVTVTNGKITDVQAVEYPTASGRDRSINARAIPELNSETQAAQSANIDMVSGATYTSRGYITSLQSALDQAGVS